MTDDFDKSLSSLKSGPVRILATYAHPEAASVELLFANGSKLQADYWRVIKDAKAGISSFDHRQQYGLPAPLDAIKELEEELRHKTLIDAQLDKETGDLVFRFSENVKFQVFNFTGYEVWHIRFPDGTGEYSNHAK